MEATDRKVLDGWRQAEPERPLFLWIYYCFPALNALYGDFHYFPGFFAHTVVEQMGLYNDAGIGGFYIENSSQCGATYLMDQLEYYVTFKLADDPTQDGDRLIDEFFDRYYGVAAEPMEALYNRIEGLFSDPRHYPEEIQESLTHQHQTEDLAWRWLGTAERMAEMQELMDHAKAATTTETESERVRLFEIGVWDYMLEGRRRHEERTEARARPPVSVTVPPVPDAGGRLDRVDWEAVADVGGWGGSSRVGPHVGQLGTAPESPMQALPRPWAKHWPHPLFGRTAGPAFSSIPRARKPLMGECPVPQNSSNLDDLVRSDTRMQRIATGFTFAEGPAWGANGALYFTDIPNDVIYRVTDDGELSEFLRPSEEANGTMFDTDGSLVICRHRARDLARVTMAGHVTVLAQEYGGRLLNSPDDCFIAADGSIYFTDPMYGLLGRAMEQDGEHVYRLAVDGTLTRVVDDMIRPNGIFISADGRTLYVSDSADAKIRGYRLQDDGSATDGHDFCDMTPDTLPDGMALDTDDNVYCTGSLGVWVIAPDGKHIGTISVPEWPANCTFGGSNNDVLYITARTSVYRIQLTAVGRR